MTICYCPVWDSPAWRARSPYLHPPGTAWPSYTTRNCVPLLLALSWGILTLLHTGNCCRDSFTASRTRWRVWHDIRSSAPHQCTCPALFWNRNQGVILLVAVCILKGKMNIVWLTEHDLRRDEWFLWQWQWRSSEKRWRAVDMCGHSDKRAAPFFKQNNTDSHETCIWRRQKLKHYGKHLSEHTALGTRRQWSI
jgi:hypothetical protein